MADGPKDFRDPKVTTSESGSSGGMGKWIGIAVGVILLLLILGWLLGLFAGDEVDAVVVPEGDEAVIVTD